MSGPCDKRQQNRSTENSPALRGLSITAVIGEPGDRSQQRRLCVGGAGPPLPVTVPTTSTSGCTCAARPSLPSVAHCPRVFFEFARLSLDSVLSVTRAVHVGQVDTGSPASLPQPFKCCGLVSGPTSGTPSLEEETEDWTRCHHQLYGLSTCGSHMFLPSTCFSLPRSRPRSPHLQEGPGSEGAECSAQEHPHPGLNPTQGTVRPKLFASLLLPNARVFRLLRTT